MARPLLVLAVVAALVVAAIVMAVSLAASARTVYTVAEVEARLRADPAAWAGRTVLVRGELETLAVGCGANVPGDSCQPIRWQEIQEVDPPPSHTLSWLVLRSAAGRLAAPAHGPDGLLLFLHRLPLIGRFVPSPWGDGASVVRLRLLTPHRPAFLAPGSPPFPDAVLLSVDDP